MNVAQLDDDANDLQDLMRRSEITVFRVYDMLAQLAERQSIKAETLQSFMVTLQKDIVSDDALLVLNAIESIHQVISFSSFVVPEKRKRAMLKTEIVYKSS